MLIPDELRLALTEIARQQGEGLSMDDPDLKLRAFEAVYKQLNDLIKENENGNA